MKCLERIQNKIAQGVPVIGTHIKTSDSTFVEQCGFLGFDFVWLDGEHPPMTIETVLRHTMAAQGTGMAAFYRVPTNDPVLCKPALDLGVDGIIFPMVKSAKEAALAVSACRYPPEGVRGWGPVRDACYGKYGKDWQLKNAEKVWKIMQIEHVEGVRNLDAILAVDGVDAITVGAMDLSCSLGIPGQTEHPEMLRLCDELSEKCQRSNKPFSISMGLDFEIAEKWVKRGIQWLSLGGEYDFMKLGSGLVLERAKKWFAER